jgi:low affinity Fe/Cu permease
MPTFSRMSHRATTFTGSWVALALLAVLTTAWLVYGWATAWSRSWELIVTTGAPIVTLVLIVILQHAQNRNARAMHVKLNELLTALRGPDDDVMDAETKPDEELRELDERYHRDLDERRAG